MPIVSGATGTTCTKDGIYKSSDRKAQYLELYVVGEVFRNFPGGKRNKTCTWYLVTGTQTAQSNSTATLSDTDGTVTQTSDGGFTGVVAVGE